VTALGEERIDVGIGALGDADLGGDIFGGSPQLGREMIDSSGVTSCCGLGAVVSCTGQTVYVCIVAEGVETDFTIKLKALA
jgi:hypothetical protein